MKRHEILEMMGNLQLSGRRSLRRLRLDGPASTGRSDTATSCYRCALDSVLINVTAEDKPRRYFAELMGPQHSLR